MELNEGREEMGVGGVPSAVSVEMLETDCSSGAPDTDAWRVEGLELECDAKFVATLSLCDSDSIVAADGCGGDWGDV